MAVDAEEMTAATASKSQVAYQWIKAAISDGRLSPGFRLVLATIANDLDMSVVPVREAIRLLESEGFVTFERNVGATVSMIDPSEYVQTMQSLGVIEGASTALAVPFITAEDIRKARAINVEMIACLDDFNPHRFTELNLQFHSVLYDRCPNPHLLDLVHREWNRLSALRDSTFSFVPERARESVAEHERLLVLIETSAPVLDVELAARDHRNATLEAFLAHKH